MSGLIVNDAFGIPLATQSSVTGMGNMGEDGCELIPFWYAVWTRSRQEKSAAAVLSTLGIQHYLPLKSELRQWSDRKQMVAAPLFSGYLFVRVSLLNSSKLQVLKIPGIVSFVGNQAGPVPIPDQQIEDIRTVLTAGVQCSVSLLLKEGDRVRVIKGPLAGVEGTLLHSNSSTRLLISIEMIRQSISVNVLREDVELLPTASGHPIYFDRATNGSPLTSRISHSAII